MKHRYISLALLIMAVSVLMALKMFNSSGTNDSSANESSQATTARSDLSLNGIKVETKSGHAAHRANTVFDKDKFISDLQSLMSAPISKGDEDSPDSLAWMFLLNNRSRISSASTAELKETYIELKKSESSTINDLVLADLIYEIMKSDPAWAIAKLEQKEGEKGVNKDQIRRLLQALGKDGIYGKTNWSPAYAAVIDEWLNKAVTDGRIPSEDVDIATLRFDLALTTGDLNGALARLKNVPSNKLEQSLKSLASRVRGSDHCRKMMEQIAPLTDAESFSKFATFLASSAGFESAREALASAKLTPEGHDFAAAGIAAQLIGPETASRADWLVSSRKSENAAAVTQFTATWTKASHKDAATWITSLPEGKVRDAATAGYAPLAARLDGQTAAEWALFISEPTLRDSIFDSVMQAWSKSEPEAAAAYLERIKKR